MERPKAQAFDWKFTSFRVNKKLLKAYVLDWVFVIIVVAIIIGVDRLEPFHRPFSVTDKTISYPYTVNQTVPEWLAAVICFFGPALIICLWSIYQTNSRTLHHGLLGLSLSFTLTLLIVVVLKNNIGRHRPDWLARCMPRNSDGSIPQDPTFGLVTIAICTQIDASMLDDGQKSFLSGHSATSFAGMVYLTLFLAGKLRLFDNKGHTSKAFICVSPLILAVWISISRIRDFRHHWQDVLAGSLVGTLFAVFSYHQYFRSIFSEESTIPFEIRWKLGMVPNNQVFLTNEEAQEFSREEGLVDPEQNRSTYELNYVDDKTLERSK